jgi:hypothetical protein
VKSYQRKDAKNDFPPDDPGNATVNFHGEKRSNQRMHRRRTGCKDGPQRQAAGRQAELKRESAGEEPPRADRKQRGFEANGTAEQDACHDVEQIPGNETSNSGGRQGYDTADFVAECRNLKGNGPEPGAAWWSAIDARTTHHADMPSVRGKERVEEASWLKTIGLLRKVRHRGVFKVGWVFTCGRGLQLVRMRNLAIQSTCRGRTVLQARK